MAAHERPRLMIVGGPNGSGKTTITEQGLAHEWFDGCEYINPDFIAQEKYGDWNSEIAVRSAARDATQLREVCLAQGRDLAFETVFSAPDKVEFVQRAVNKGYFVRLFFVATRDPSINAARIARRFMDGGHEVPITKIVQRYFRSIANCVAAAQIVDRLYLYDNSVEDVAPKLVLRASAGKIYKQYGEIPDWMMPIVAELATTGNS